MWDFDITWRLSFVVCHLLTFHILNFSSVLKPISQMNWNLVGSIYGRSSLKSAHFVMIHYQTWPSTGKSCFWLANFKNLLLWNRLVKLTKTWQEASMEFSLWRLLISSQSVNKHGHHRQFLFLIDSFLKNFSIVVNC